MHEWGKYRDVTGQILSGTDIRAAIATYDLMGRILIVMKLWRIDYDTAIALIKNEYEHVHATPVATV